MNTQSEWRPPDCRRCGRRHRRWRTYAACRLKPILWILGQGRFASIGDCPIHGRGEGRTVILYDTLVEAETAKSLIDRLACGGCCMRMHRVIDLWEPTEGGARP